MEEEPKAGDIISIDGRWAQVAAQSEGEGQLVIKWLNDESKAHIDLSKYKLIQKINALAWTQDFMFSPKEIDHIYQGLGQAGKAPKIIVFGRYQSTENTA